VRYRQMADARIMAKGWRLGFVQRLLGLATLAALPALAVAMLLIWRPGPSSHAGIREGAGSRATGAGVSAGLRWPLTFVVLGAWGIGLLVLRERVVRPLQTLANLLSALREGDYSFRARSRDAPDALAEAMREVNALVETMRRQRLGALEATALLRAVMAEIDVAVFAFDADQCLRLANRAGERLLAQPVERLLGRNAVEVGLADCLAGEAPRTVQMSFAGGSGRWRIHRQQFRQGGLPHQLLVLADLSRELREEERLAWQRLVRVLGHELNNSLAPVKSLAGTLADLTRREPLPPDWRDDMRDGLGVIASRAESLNRFVAAYAQLARLPQPKLQSLDLGGLIRRVASLETRVAVRVVPGPDLRLGADPDQLEQAVINLVRNAADAVLEAQAPASGPGGGGGEPGESGRVRVGWRRVGAQVEIWVEDDGPGLSNTANLFVPFFTTKPKGSGIGLVLCRQIAEGHGGFLTLENAPAGRGCLARLRLPVRSTEKTGQPAPAPA